MVVGTRIKRMRMRHGISQQQLGDLIGVTKVSVCGYETGTRTPNVETLESIADAFGISIDYLLGREVPIINDENKKYVGSISVDDVMLIQELRHYPNLYNKIIKDVKRSVSIINKKITND